MTSAFNKSQFLSSAVKLDFDSMDLPERCLVLAPHPDDESLACAGLMAMLNEQGAEVQIILTTDGGGSHPNSRKYPSEKLSKLREAELKTAIAHIGLAPTALKCYYSSDSAMPSRGQEGFEELTLKLSQDIKAFKPQLILVPYELDPHRDHRATWQLLMSALELAEIARPKIWEYPIWLYELAGPNDVPQIEAGELIAVDISKFLETKKRCIDAHVSQCTTLIDDDPTGFMLSEAMISNFITGTEYFLQRSKLNPSSSLAKNYFEAIYDKNIDPWNFEKSTYEREKYLSSIQSIPQKNYTSALEIGCSIGIFTEMIDPFCDHLIAMDISSIALAEAKNRLAGVTKIDFRQGSIPDNFPDERFDLIVMSEVGYYLCMEDLLKTRALIEQQLNKGGILLLVHWIHFVVDYPISGDQVHECFLESSLKNLHSHSTKDYRVNVLQKV